MTYLTLSEIQDETRARLKAELCELATYSARKRAAMRLVEQQDSSRCIAAYARQQLTKRFRAMPVSWPRKK